MRTLVWSSVLAACLVAPALAQTGGAPAYPPPGVAPPSAPPAGFAPPAYPAGPQPPPPMPGTPMQGAPMQGSSMQGMPMQNAPMQGSSMQGMPMQSAPMPGTPGGAQYQQQGTEPLSNRASNIDQNDTQSDIAPALPSTGLGSNASPLDYLHAAESALLAGQTGQTQEALAQAETRLLNRSVPYGMVNMPSRNPAVADITGALHALAAGDRATCLQYIRAAIPAAAASLR